MDEFVHLENQSAYSFLWGTYTPEELVRAAASLGQKAVALTDDGLFGTVRFCRAAEAAGVQAIVGARLPLADGSWITILVRDRTGYGHLCRLSGLAYMDGLRPGPRVKPEDLRRWSKGLICLAGGRGSPMDPGLTAGRVWEARTWLNGLKDCWDGGPETLYVALRSRGRAEDFSAAKRTADLADSLGLPTVAVNGTAFLKPEDFPIHRTLVEIQRKYHHRRIDPLPGPEYYLASGREMARRLPFPQALANTGRIARMCRSFKMPFGRVHPPRSQPEAQAAQKLTGLCYRELAERFHPVPQAYCRRLDRELEIAGKRSLADFFLLVREAAEFAQRNKIRHSVRGSAAGSLMVCLLLGGVDPLAHGLLFERFLNDGRTDLPDVDIDFDSERRDEVIHYLMDRYPGRTALVSTVHTLKVRSAVRLAARALGYPLDAISRLCQCLPWSLKGLGLKEALETLPELRQSPLNYEPRLVEAASCLARLPFQNSVHLGGVVLAPGDIQDWTVVGLSPKGFPVGHLDKDDVEALGLLKLDLLGLRMHTAIRKSVEVLARQGLAVQPERLPLDDPKTFKLLRSTETVGVFQVESPGQRQLLGRLEPGNFGDLIAEISLFRPGPVEGNLVDPYIRRRNGEEPVEYSHPDLAPILEETYGLIIFQEQVLRIVHAMAGLSPAEADAFRRTMTKDRHPERMKQLKSRFMAGAANRGHSEKLAETVWSQVLVLAAYGFCKAHAASFAHITYQSAWLKAHHPQAFFIGLLNAGRVGSYPAWVILNEARRRGVPVYGPHVNISGPGFAAEGRGIRVPLTVVKGVGPNLASRILKEREGRGLFEDHEDFCTRVLLPERLTKGLVLAGALDGLASRARRFDYSVGQN